MAGPKKVFTLIVPIEIHTTMLRVAARLNQSPEQIIESLIEREFSSDGRTRTERAQIQQQADEADRKRRLGLSGEFVSVGDYAEDNRLPVRSRDVEAEISRLLELVSEQ